MIFRREFSKNLKPLIIWSLLLGGLVFLVLSMYSTFAEQQEGLQSMFESFPEPLKKMFGMHDLDFSTILGFYAIEAYLMITLFGSIYAAMLSANLIVKEESEKTIEFLLAMPVTRNVIVSSKLLLVIVNLLIFNAFITLVTWLGFQISGDANVSFGSYMLFVIGALLTHLIFAAVAFLLSSIMRRSRNVWPAAIGIVFVTYFLDAVAGISEKTEFLKQISPFHYFNATGILTNSRIEGVYVFVSLALIVLCFGAAFVIYKKKDITV